MNRKIASKLANSVRQARSERPHSPPSNREPDAVASRVHSARQDDQSPPASVYQPWDNLHPKRIWPD